MKNQLKIRVQVLLLLGMCFVLLGQNLTTLAHSKFDAGKMNIESSGETESESNEKISDTEIEFEDYNFQTVHWRVHAIELAFLFPNYINHFVPTFSDGRDLPPEC